MCIFDMPSNKPSTEPQTQPPLWACCTRAPGPCRRPGLREQAHLPLPCDVRGWVRDHQQASHALERHCTSGARVELGTCAHGSRPGFATINRQALGGHKSFKMLLDELCNKVHATWPILLDNPLINPDAKQLAGQCLLRLRLGLRLRLREPSSPHTPHPSGVCAAQEMGGWVMMASSGSA